jgi:hypothetical protein
LGQGSLVHIWGREDHPTKLWFVILDINGNPALGANARLALELQVRKNVEEE